MESMLCTAELWLSSWGMQKSLKEIPLLSLLSLSSVANEEDLIQKFQFSVVAIHNLSRIEGFNLPNTSAKTHMDKNATIEEAEGLRSGVELVRPASDKHFDLLRPSARNYSVFKGQATEAAEHEKGKYTLIKDVEDFQVGMYDKPLPCFGCGVGWFSFLSGFVFPLMWYYATFLYFGNYYRKDPRERAGLAASAVAAMTCSFVLLIMGIVLLF